MEIIDAGKVRIGVSATRVNGVDYVDVRLHITDHQGLMRPTQNGLPIPLHRLQAVINAMQSAQDSAEQLEAQPLFYFKERADMERTAYAIYVTSTAKQAVQRTPEEYMSESGAGFLFRGTEYELVGTTYKFLATKPFAVWDNLKHKWVRCEKRRVSNEQPRKEQPVPKSQDRQTAASSETRPAASSISTLRSPIRIKPA